MMMQNIKTDIIYYKTNTDFELEFSICGCCRMRLLTDKVANTKNLIPSMARAVSRSRIILIIGNLFGDDGIISLASRAIGKKLTTINNSDFGIADNSEIKIISGSTPLVSPQGIFGGCIIESGPQTLVLLTESKSVRKSIMNTLIYPYVTELAAQLYKESAEKETKPVTETSDTAPEPIVEQADEDLVADEILEEAETVAEPSETIAEAENVAEPDETEQEPAETSAQPPMTHAAEEDTKSQEDDIVFEAIEYPEEEEEKADDDFYEPEFSSNSNRKTSSANLFMLITAILLFVSIAVFCYAVLYVPTQNSLSPYEYIREIFSTLFG